MAARQVTSRSAPRRRPAARRPAARRGPSRVRWDRVGRIALTLVLGIVLFSYLNPALDFVHVYQGTTKAKAALRTLQHENDKLHRQVQSADDPAVLEREARRQGMVGAYEQSYVIVGKHNRD